MSGLGGYQRPATPGYEPPSPAPVNPTDFDPFAALGLDPATATPADVRPAFRQAMRHRHESAVARHAATANSWPSQSEVQQAHDYLTAPYTFEAARRQWQRVHRAVFFPSRPVGDRAVFASPAAAAMASPSTATPGSSARRSYRTPGTATASSSGPGSAQQPFTFSDSEEEGPRQPRRREYVISSGSDDDGYESPTPRARAGATASAAAPASASAARGRARARAGATAALNRRRASASDVRRRASRSRPAARTANRSGGSSSRHASIAHPVINERIVVGEWAGASGARRNAVVAGFDARGRQFYRITNEDVNGDAVAAPTATATRWEEVIFRPPYRGMTADAVRTAVDQHLRMNPYMRP